MTAGFISIAPTIGWSIGYIFAVSLAKLLTFFQTFHGILVQFTPITTYSVARFTKASANKSPF